MVAVPAENTMSPLVTGVRATPPDAVAVNVIVSAFEYTGVDIVTLLAPIPILPVRTPLNVPPPVALLRVMVVALPRFDEFPLASWDSTVTLKAVPAVPVPGTVV